MKLNRKQQIISLLLLGLLAFILPVPKGLLGLITPISLVLFFVILLDFIRDSFRKRK